MKKEIIKWGIAILVSGLVIGGSAAIYLFNMPHRDVQASSVDFHLDAKVLVDEYLTDLDVRRIYIYYYTFFNTLCF